MKQIQVLINRQNIPTKVKDNPNAVEDFIDVVVDAHVVAAALTFFGMESAESTPTKNINIAAIKSLPLKERQSRLLHAVSNLVSKYVMSTLTWLLQLLCQLKVKTVFRAYQRRPHLI